MPAYNTVNGCVVRPASVYCSGVRNWIVIYLALTMEPRGRRARRIKKQAIHPKFIHLTAVQAFYRFRVRLFGMRQGGEYMNRQLDSCRLVV